MKTAIWWIRRDLRLGDNSALAAALESADLVCPVFILDPGLVNSGYVGEKRLAFLFEGLRRLDDDLRRRGGYLILRQGRPVEELHRLVQSTGAEQIFAQADYSPYALKRDDRALARLPLVLSGGPAVQPPGAVVKPDGSPYTVFTPFSKAWKALPGLDGREIFHSPDRVPTPQGIDSLPVPDAPYPAALLPFVPGEQQAIQRLEQFTREGIFRYGVGRDRSDIDGTSGLSPYLRFGMLSPRQAASAAVRAGRDAVDADAHRGAETWLNELIWREFYIHILYHFPQVRRQNFRLPQVRWNNDVSEFDAWKTGQTGYPIIDASMRQLVETGWISNRSRMIVASFLTKDLLIDWRWGERWFMQHLIDGDPAANNGGWQWTAGTGTDAAPYFRVFNPVLQSLKTDPNGSLIRRWLPQLNQVPQEHLHSPWTMPTDVQQEIGCVIGRDYPAPIVDHAWAKDRAVAAYRASESNRG